MPLRIVALALIVVCCGCRSATHQTSNQRMPEAVAKPANVGAENNPESERPVRVVSYEAPVNALAPEKELTLSQCIAAGLAQNPDLITARQAESVSSAALGVAQTYPFNPFVQVQATPYQNARFGGPGTTYHYVLLMQTIQLAHQQQFREEGAAAMLNSTRWNIHQSELLNVAQTERLYFTMLYQRGLMGLANAVHANNRELLRTLEKQLEAGQASAADVAMVRIDTASTLQQARLAKANYETAVRDLKRQLGIAPDDPTIFPGDLRAFVWRRTLCDMLEPRSVDIGLPLPGPTEQERTLVAARANSRPDVMAAHSDVDAARANLCLATASKTPDLQIGPYYQRTADGTDFLGFRGQMDLPIINTGRPLELQRDSELAQRITAWQQISRRAELEALAAWERYKLALDAATDEASELDADVPAELQRLEQEFIAGEVDVVRVIQARTSIIQNQRARLDLLNEVAQSAANVTASSGIPIEELLAPPMLE